MALVDYTSSDSESGSAAKNTGTGGAHTTTAAAVKKRKLSHNSSSKTACVVDDRDTEDGGANSKKPARSMPPLPPAFHDLYASTVRVSTSDDPTLHQGRKRVNPHKVGNWPSHLYIEWHPTPSQRAHLTTLLSDLQTAITTSTSTSTTATPSPPPINLTSFLTSDLSAPQPLHISLSRPIVLTTPQKAPFLSDLAARLVRGSGSTTPAHAFDLVPRALEWHRGPESERTFLVLRVATATATATTNPNPNPNPNPELSVLLRRCNDLVTSYGQPALYAGGTGGEGENEGDRFHVSLAWTFSAPTAALARATADVAGPFFAASGGEGQGGEGARMRIRVDGVKAKIGNVVTSVELPVVAGGRGRGRGKGRGRRRGSGSGDGDGDGGSEGEGVGSGILGV